MSGALLLLGMLALTAAGQVAFKHHHLGGGRAWLAAAVALFVSVVPMSYLAVQRFGIAVVYLFMSLSYAVVALLGWRLFGERVRPRQWCGIGLVVAGCILFNL
jgi:undecaprenyl phosphate-alpha-L-ara4N flippase subunit ArnE